MNYEIVFPAIVLAYFFVKTQEFSKLFGMVMFLGISFALTITGLHFPFLLLAVGLLITVKYIMREQRRQIVVLRNSQQVYFENLVKKNEALAKDVTLLKESSGRKSD